MEKLCWHSLAICLSVPLLTSSCHETMYVQADRRIEIPEVKRHAVLKDLFTDFKIVALEDNEQCMLSWADKMQCSDSMFFVLNRRPIPSLLVFNHEGCFCRKIGQRGKGHGEYRNIVDFAIDEKNRRVYLLDELSTVLEYKMDGRFVKSVRLSKESYYRNILKTDAGFVFSTNHFRVKEHGDRSLLYFYDNDYRFVCEKIEVLPEPVMQPSFVRYPLQKDGNTICYHDNFNTCFHFFSQKDTAIHESVALYDERLFDYTDAVSERLYKQGPDYDKITSEYYADGIVYGWGMFYKGYNAYQYDVKKRKLKVSIYTDWNPELSNV